jgi:hypothetical protein
MFTVLLIACIGQDPQCFNIRDDWGPYTSLEQCGQRLEQMALNVEQNFSPVIFFQRKCILNEKVETKEKA